MSGVTPIDSFPDSWEPIPIGKDTDEIRLASWVGQITRRGVGDNAMTDNELRYTNYPWPPYTYVPGAAPHPFKEGGHGCPGPPHPAIEPLATSFQDVWRQSSMYLWGIDLFNHGFYWEAHEAWEGIWRQLDQQPAAANWCKGLIKLAATGVKVREGRLEGAQRHARRAAQLFESVNSASAEARFCGLSPSMLHPQAQRVAEQLDMATCRKFQVRQTPPQPVIVFSFKLQLMQFTMSDSPDEKH